VGALLKLDSQSLLMRQLFQGTDVAQMQMEVIPGVPPELALREHPMRLLSGTPLGAVELPYIPFKIARFGRKEITLTSCSRLPVEISITLKVPPEQGANITIRPQISGGDAADVAKVIQFLDALERTGELEIFTIDPPGRLFSEVGNFSNGLKLPEEFKRVLLQAAQISTYFGVPLKVPEEITRRDIQKIEMLMHVVTGESVSGFNVSANFVKESQFRDKAVHFLRGNPVSMRMENPTAWSEIEIFGRKIDVGPIAFVVEVVTVLDAEITLRKYLDAPEGSLIDWKAECKGVCRFERCASPVNQDMPGWLFTFEDASDDSVSS
jgi:hypothetical protein